jgi:hypothetical protein
MKQPTKKRVDFLPQMINTVFSPTAKNTAKRYFMIFLIAYCMQSWGNVNNIFGYFFCLGRTNSLKLRLWKFALIQIILASNLLHRPWAKKQEKMTKSKSMKGNDGDRKLASDYGRDKAKSGGEPKKQGGPKGTGTRKSTMASSKVLMASYAMSCLIARSLTHCKKSKF